MSATVHSRAAAFLRRAGLLAAVLAITGGILGMHILTATHSMQSPASAAATAAGRSVAASSVHTGHPAGVFAQGRFLERAAAGTAMGQCPESGDCTTGMHSMTAACVPSAKTAPMAAPPPGTLILGISNHTAAGPVTGQWTYLPISPSPCELSISRT